MISIIKNYKIVKKYLLIFMLFFISSVFADEINGLDFTKNREIANPNYKKYSNVFGEYYPNLLAGYKKNRASFSYNNEKISIIGDIDKDFYEKFKKYLDKYPQTKTILISSTGGNVDNAIMTGQLIRERNLDTQLNGNCNSSCVLIFLGGINRIIPNSNFQIGLHKLHIKTKEGKIEDVDFDEEYYSDIVEYIENMLSYDEKTVSFIIDIIKNTPSGKIYKPSNRELSKYCVATVIKNYKTSCYN